MSTKRFLGGIYAGHTTDCGVLVPFDPSVTWGSTKPLPIGYQKHTGYAVRGTVDGAPFESWIFLYAAKWRMVVPGAAMAAADVAAGDTATFVVRPHPQAESVPKFVPGPKRGACSADGAIRESRGSRRRSSG